MARRRKDWLDMGDGVRGVWAEAGELRPGDYFSYRGDHYQVTLPEDEPAHPGFGRPDTVLAVAEDNTRVTFAPGERVVKLLPRRGK